jgi:ribosomal protein L13E
MSLDRNKTCLTHRVTALAAAYLDGIGCKPVETEVEIRSGWIADVASYWYPTMTECKKLGLPKKVREMLGIADDHRDLVFNVYGHGPFTVLAEVKVSRADFQKDDRKWNWPPAHLCFVAFPSGVLKAEELPAGWMGLECSANGEKIIKVHRTRGFMHAQHPGLTLDFVAAVGIRRDHRSRHRAIRDWWRHYRSEERERKANYSAADLLSGVAAWLRNDGSYTGELEDVLAMNGVKKLPKRIDKPLEFFKSLRAQHKEQSA